MMEFMIHHSLGHDGVYDRAADVLQLKYMMDFMMYLMLGLGVWTWLCVHVEQHATDAATCRWVQCNVVQRQQWQWGWQW